jgi:hypothetical protein
MSQEPENQPENQQEFITINGEQFQVIKELKQNTNQSYNRVTVVESIYHENIDGPHQIHAQPFSYNLQSDEQTYTRIMTVGTEWTKLDTGWLNNKCSLIHLLNLGSRVGPTRPTEQESQEAESKIVELSIQHYIYTGKEPSCKEPNHLICSYLSPRKSIRVEPKGPKCNLSDGYYLRCRSGTTRVQITALPE